MPAPADAVCGYGEHLVLAHALADVAYSISYTQFDEGEPQKDAETAELQRRGTEATELLDGTTVEAERVQLVLAGRPTNVYWCVDGVVVKSDCAARSRSWSTTSTVYSMSCAVRQGIGPGGRGSPSSTGPRAVRASRLRAAAACLILRPMGVIEFQLERTVRAPIHEVFARLSDINGHNEWMPKKGSIFRHTQQTSVGEPALGTTFLDETAYGPTPGEIVEFHAPYTLVYHWWDSSKSGRLKAEGWPGYSLEAAEDGTTLVRHHARMHTYGIYRLATPIFRRIAVRERTATVDALRASFESSG